MRPSLQRPDTKRPGLKHLVLAAAAAAFACPAALAATTHVELVALPGGGVARIAYAGDTPPSVMVAPARTLAVPMAMPVAMPMAMASPFALLARMEAEMDRQTNLMLREAGFVQSSPGAGATMFGDGVVGRLPLVSASLAADPRACVEQTSVTEVAGEKPRVAVFRSAGCGGAAAAAPRAPASLAPAPFEAHPAPRLIEARLETPAAP